MSKNQQTGSKATPSQAKPSQAKPSRNNLPHNSAAKPFPKTFNESAFVTQQHQAANKTASPRVCATKTTFAAVLMFVMGSAAQGQTAQPQGEALAPVQTHWRATAETLTLPGLEEVTRLFEETLTSGPATEGWRPARGGSDVDPRALLESGGALG